MWAKQAIAEAPNVVKQAIGLDEGIGQSARARDADSRPTLAFDTANFGGPSVIKTTSAVKSLYGRRVEAHGAPGSNSACVQRSWIKNFSCNKLAMSNLQDVCNVPCQWGIANAE